MGRPRMNEETIKEMTVRLIVAARTLILRDGLDNVTIRSIAKETTLNSASLYKYFKDLDELLLFACVDLFKAYSEDLIRHTAGKKLSARDLYLLSWRLFCKHAFAQPVCVNHLFFSRHSGSLGSVIEAYYALFPELLEGMTEPLQLMVRAADLFNRNLEVLRPALASDGVSEAQLSMCNELTVAYFRMLLNEAIRDGEQTDADAQTARMLSACELLLTLGS